MDEEIIKIVNLHKSFGDKEVLNGLNLSIYKGEILTILGGSGEGKTVLLKHIIGLLKPEKGEIWIDGYNVANLNESELLKIRKRIGMLFQGAALFDSLSVKENIAYPLREHLKLREEEIDRKVKEKLKLVGLVGIEDKMPSDLSGGMKKRVGLARAIATDSEIILYDEPTTGLDPINARRICQLISDLNELLNITSVIVTHDLICAFSISNRLAFMDGGRIIFTGTPEEMMRAEEPQIIEFLEGHRSLKEREG